MVTPTKKYASTYGASPRNDAKYVAAARRPAKPAVVQVVPPPPPPARQLTGEYWGARNHWFTREQRDFILDHVIPELEESMYYLFTYYLRDCGYGHERALALTKSEAQRRKEVHERAEKLQKELDDKWKSYVPTDEDIKNNFHASGVMRVVNNDVGQLCTCCGTMSADYYPTYLADTTFMRTGSSWFRRVWYSYRKSTEEHPHPKAVHPETLLLETGNDSLQLMWADE